MKANFTLTKSQIEQLCRAGSQAPSGGNAQPWHVDVRQNQMLISIDPKRSNNALDVNCTASIFSLGSFAENVILEANLLGLRSTVKILTGKNFSQFRVNICFETSDEINDTELAKYISKRLTNRQFYNGAVIPERLIDKLIRSLGSSNIKLYLKKNKDEKKEIVDILGVADGIRFTNNEMRKYMFKEMRWNKKDTLDSRDGLDVDTLEMPKNLVKMMQMMNKIPTMVKLVPTKAFEDQIKPLLMGSSHLCCLSFKNPVNESNLFEAGRAMQRFWLLATKLKLSIHPWTVLPFFIFRSNVRNDRTFNEIERKKIKSLDTRLHMVFGMPDNFSSIFIFRMFYSKPPTARSLRIAWDKFTSY